MSSWQSLILNPAIISDITTKLIFWFAHDNMQYEAKVIQYTCRHPQPPPLFSIVILLLNHSSTTCRPGMFHNCHKPYFKDSDLKHLKIIFTKMFLSFQKPFDTIAHKSNQTKFQLTLFGVQKFWDNLIKTYISSIYLFNIVPACFEISMYCIPGPHLIKLVITDKGQFLL